RDRTAKDAAARPASAGEVALRAGQLRDGLAGRPTAPPPASEPGGPPPAKEMGAEPVTLAGELVPLAGEPVPLAWEPVPLAGDPGPMAGDPVLMAREPVPMAGEPVPWAGGPVPWAGEPATLVAASVPGPPPTHRRPRREWPRPGRGVLLAVAGVA